MDVRRTRRKMYTCLHCLRIQRVHVGERYRVVYHIYKNHLALDQAPFYCTLCLFRCISQDALEKHVTRFSRHTKMAGSMGGDPRRFLVKNPNPTHVMEGVDFREASMEEMARRPGNIADDILGLEDDWLDDESSHDGQGLISVKMTPQQLAMFMEGKQNAHQPPQEYDPKRPSYTSGLNPFGSNSSASVVHTLKPAANTLPGLTQRAPTLYAPSYGQPVPGSVTCLTPAVPICKPVPNMPLPSQVHGQFETLAPPLIATTLTTTDAVSIVLPSFGDTFITSGLDTSPQLSSVLGLATKSPRTTVIGGIAQSVSAINTPLIPDKATTTARSPSVEDIKEQLMGTDFDFAVSPVKTAPAIETSDKENQTDPALRSKTEDSPTATSMAVAHLEKALEVSFGRLIDAVDRNSRAIREVEKTLNRSADSLLRMERAVDRIVVEKRTANRAADETERAEKRPKLGSKENLPSKTNTNDKKSSRK